MRSEEQDGWLDPETAERVLRGLPPEAATPAAQQRAERLADALRALAPPPGAADAELPGEAAALAAFRAARGGRAEGALPLSGPSAPTSAELPDGAAAARTGPAERPPARTPAADAAPRRTGAPRSRWGRPLRFGLAAALAACTVGGVAFAAGTGVLPAPFRGTAPEPAATVSAEGPGRPSPAPSPLDGVQGGTRPAATPPGHRATAPSAPGATRGTGPEDADPAVPDARRPALAAACRRVRAGERPDGDPGRVLAEAAGGAARVAEYCADVLAGRERTGRERGGDGDGDGGRVRDGDHGDHGDRHRSRGRGKDAGPEGRDPRAGRDDNGRASDGARGDKPGREAGDGRDGARPGVRKGRDGHRPAPLPPPV
ncbi:hypothetical protein ACGFZL_07910 [Streptomyces sp. NPDC048182]|uniref:hypothetical protein n=1 Tax=Streptomyces sp. NPDC048182 TaxID=3365507 RepID=UPI003711D3DC